MADQEPDKEPYWQDATLVVRKIIHATAERLFMAWTQPEQLKQWWGPESVICVDAEVDLRVGGSYQIVNQLPDGKLVSISGEFQVIEPPHKLVYTWRIEPESHAELVTVLFEPKTAGGTEVIVVHERIPNKTARDAHEHGWHGCLNGLAEYLS